MKHRQIMKGWNMRYLSVPLGLLIGVTLAYLLTANITVMMVVAFCATVIIVAWQRGRWII